MQFNSFLIFDPFKSNNISNGATKQLKQEQSQDSHFLKFDIMNGIFFLPLNYVFWTFYFFK